MFHFLFHLATNHDASFLLHHLVGSTGLGYPSISVEWDGLFRYLTIPSNIQSALCPIYHHYRQPTEHSVILLERELIKQC
jgi:hypothetical protein